MEQKQHTIFSKKLIKSVHTEVLCFPKNIQEVKNI